jgi:hypothetical protein
MKNNLNVLKLSQYHKRHLSRLALIVVFGLLAIVVPGNRETLRSQENAFAGIEKAFLKMDASYLKPYLSQESKIYFSFPILDIKGDLFSAPHFLNLMQESVFKEVETISFSFSEHEPVSSKLSPQLLKKAVWKYLVRKTNKKYDSEILFSIETGSGNLFITRIHTSFTENQ